MDTFCSLGPWIDTEFSPKDQKITGYHNSTLIREDNVGNRLVKEPDLLMKLSNWITLEAGDVIDVELESITDQKELGQFDETQSGKYIILHLCHHFDEKKSITALTLVRDTYGRRR